jgi:hypothetical protein
MDLKAYYRKLREIERQVLDDYVVVKSLATPDGGVAGRLTEVAKNVAAKMVVDGLAELADPAESEAFRKEALEQKKREDQRREAARIQFTVLSEGDLRKLHDAGKSRSRE